MAASTLHPQLCEMRLWRQLRATKHRREKPFAIMAKSLDAAKSFAEVTSKEQELALFPCTPNRFAKQKPKLQFVAFSCAEPA